MIKFNHLVGYYKNKIMDPILSVDIDWIKSYNQVNLLFEFVTKKLEKCEQIIFIDCHHNILNYLSKEDKFIINVDHHHDIFQPQVKEDSRYIHIGNWVKELIDNNNLDSYFWINNPNSFLEDSNLDPVRAIKSFKILDNLNDINKFNYKKIVICRSFDYFTEMEKNQGFANIFNLFQILALSLYKEKTIIDNQPNPYSFKLK